MIESPNCCFAFSYRRIIPVFCGGCCKYGFDITSGFALLGVVQTVERGVLGSVGFAIGRLLVVVRVLTAVVLIVTAVVVGEDDIESGDGKTIGSGPVMLGNVLVAGCASLAGAEFVCVAFTAVGAGVVVRGS